MLAHRMQLNALFHRGPERTFITLVGLFPGVFSQMIRHVSGMISSIFAAGIWTSLQKYFRSQCMLQVRESIAFKISMFMQVNTYVYDIKLKFLFSEITKIRRLGLVELG